MGNILPQSVVSALSVGLYGMFLAVIIPASKRDRIILGVVVVSMAASLALGLLPLVSSISAGTRTILITVVIASCAAILFPVKEAEEENDP